MSCSCHVCHVFQIALLEVTVLHQILRCIGLGLVGLVGL